MTDRATTHGGEGGTGSWPLRRAPEDLIRPPQVPGGSLLVLAPHADDEVLATGGLIQVHAARGDRVRVLFLTDGSRGGFRDDRDAEYVKLREREAVAGLEVLGVTDWAFLRHPDQGLSTATDLPAQIAAELDSFRPDVLTVTSPFEVHPDHLAAGAALAAALPLASADLDPRILLVEIGAPHVANWILDISSGDLVANKCKALACHASQLADADFEDKMLGLNRYRTVNCGEKSVRYAEAYLELRAQDLTPMMQSLQTLLPLVERTRPSVSWAATSD